MTLFAVASYSVSLGRLQLLGMSDNPDTWAAAGIRCRTNTTGAFLDIAFMPQGIPLPPNAANVYGPGSGHTCYRPMSELAAYVDILRNESPVNVEIDAQRPAKNGLRTANEAVGEGE